MLYSDIQREVEEVGEEEEEEEDIKPCSDEYMRFLTSWKGA